MLIAGLCFHTDVAACCRQFRGTMAEWFAAQYKSDDEDSGTGLCPAGASGYEHDTDFKNDDLQGHGVYYVNTSAECCSICASTLGCNGMSFGPLPRFGCRLKKGDAGRMHMKGRTSVLIRRVPSPPPPPQTKIKEIHVVFSNHFDGGCKIGGCNNVSSAEDFMWPIGCATTMHGPGQPHAYHVINRYFDEFFPLAASIGDEFRAAGKDRYVWM